MLIEDIAKGGRNEDNAMMTKTVPLFTVLANWQPFPGNVPVKVREVPI